MTHLSATLPDRIELGAERVDDWFTDIVSTDGGNEYRTARWEESLRSYHVSAPKMRLTDPDYISMVALYEAAGGNLHTFNFTDWTDDDTVVVRFDGPLEIIGVTPEIMHVSFTLIEVRA